MEPERGELRRLAPEQTFYVRGLSKNYAAARTRTGVVVCPERLSEMENVIEEHELRDLLVHNMAAMRLIEDGTLERGSRRSGWRRSTNALGGNSWRAVGWVRVRVASLGSLPGGIDGGRGASEFVWTRGDGEWGRPGFTARVWWCRMALAELGWAERWSGRGWKRDWGLCRVIGG